MELLNNIQTFFENLGVAQTIFWLAVIVFGAWGNTPGANSFRKGIG